MTYKERERETVRRLRAEWERRHRGERMRQKETESQAHAPIRLDEEAEVLYEFAAID